MAHELNVDKRMVGLNVERSLHRMIVKKFGQEGDIGYNPAYRRALEEATAGYHLTPEDYREIAAEAEEALKERMAKRNNTK